MAKFIFKYSDVEGSREATAIEFDIPDDMDVHEFKIICMRMASSLGYTQKSILKSFGKYTTERLDESIELLDICTDKESFDKMLSNLKISNYKKK